MTSGFLNAPFLVFVVLLSVGVTSLAVHIRARIAEHPDSPIDPRVFASAITICVGPTLFSLTLMSQNIARLVNTGGGSPAYSPLWIFFVVPVLASICATGLAFFRVGPKGTLAAGHVMGGGAVWVSLAIIAPTIALLDSISIVDVFFLLLASAAALAIDRTAHDINGLETPSQPCANRTASSLSYVLLIVCSIGSALVVTTFPDGQGVGALTVIPVFIALVVCLLLPLAIAVASCNHVSFALMPLIGDVGLLLLLLGCTGLVGKEVWLEIASMVSQLRANLEAGLAPVFFQTREMAISGFARIAPGLFLVIPLAGIALFSSPNSSEPVDRMTRPGAMSRLLGVSLVLFSLVVLSWKLSSKFGV